MYVWLFKCFGSQFKYFLCRVQLKNKKITSSKKNIENFLKTKNKIFDNFYSTVSLYYIVGSNQKNAECQQYFLQFKIYWCTEFFLHENFGNLFKKGHIFPQLYEELRKLPMAQNRFVVKDSGTKNFVQLITIMCIFTMKFPHMI